MDFSNRQNRFVRIHEVSEEYLADIEHKTQTDQFYPSYHITPKHDLLNDPNGLSYFIDELSLVMLNNASGTLHYMSAIQATR
ncbi:hypothetical protein PYE51_18110 [Vibrio aestuarianus]|uniref:Uncharacterized protein n=1 Tax=Vibrio aestuarianus TaxID=28171 RepID=A0AAX3U9S1_9VIBR|nr:hypothetical protein [Vibrio aestuarianus]WGK83270.1 hypothetical protein PYE51_18110 [Vibrio aestuarianus]